MRISGNAPPRFAVFMIIWVFVAFVWNNFFLIVQLQTLLIIDVCLMLNCFFFEKFFLYALCDFDSILLHYAKLFIRQSIDSEQIFDVTFDPPPPPH